MFNKELNAQKASRNANRDRGIQNLLRQPGTTGKVVVRDVKNFIKKVGKREK